MIKTFNMLVALSWEIGGLVVLWNSSIGEIAHLEGLIMVLSGFITIILIGGV